jgi:hypothetical protein
MFCETHDDAGWAVSPVKQPAPTPAVVDDDGWTNPFASMTQPMKTSDSSDSLAMAFSNLPAKSAIGTHFQKSSIQ